jgi:ABC-type multidrug transport system fused ATPase/permease subunit
VPTNEPAGSTWRTAWRLFAFVVRVDPRMFAITVTTGLIGSIAEGFGLVLLLPLLSVAGMNFSGSSKASRLGVEAQRLLVLAGIPPSFWLPVVLGVFLATGALRSMLRRSQSSLLNGTVTRVQLSLSRRVYEAVVRAQWGFLVRQRAGKLTHMLTSELRQVTDAAVLLLSLTNAAGLTLLYLCLALKLSGTMTLLVLLIGGFLMIVQRHSIGRMRDSGRQFRDSVGEVYAATDEHLLNLKSVKTYNAEERDVRLFADLCAEVGHHAITNAGQQAASAFRFEVGSLFALGCVIFLSLSVLHVQAATMLLLLAIFTRLMPQLATMQNQANILTSILPSFDHVLAIESECVAHAEPLPAENDAGHDAEPLSLEHEFRLEDVWFTYGRPAGTESKEDEFVLRGLDLTIQAGLMTVLVGPSGAGKSTIADLTNGLLQPTRGQLLLDGRALDPGEIRHWRHQVGYVGQETVLFHQSIRDNLLWAQPNASEADLREALELASASFVYELPRGLETIAGDRGILLSGGQRQRISLARALLRKPRLLILDEATNALDVENEARVLDAIREVIRESKRRANGVLTVLMIAHRASAIRRADRIFELEGGRIARSGTWEEINGSV